MGSVDLSLKPGKLTAYVVPQVILVATKPKNYASHAVYANNWLVSRTMHPGHLWLAPPPSLFLGCLSPSLAPFPAPLAHHTPSPLFPFLYFATSSEHGSCFLSDPSSHWQSGPVACCLSKPVFWWQSDPVFCWQSDPVFCWQSDPVFR